MVRPLWGFLPATIPSVSGMMLPYRISKQMLDVCYRDYYDDFYNYISKKFSCYDIADDLVNQTYLELLEKNLTKPISNPNALKAFVYQQLVVTYLAEKRGELSRKEDMGIVNGIIYETPENAYAVREMNVQLMKEIKLLPFKAARAASVMMHYPTFDEAAKFLSINPIGLAINFRQACTQLRPNVELYEKDLETVYFLDNQD